VGTDGPLNLKSKREIALMRKAGLAVWHAHQIATSMFKAGTTTRQVDAAVEAYFDQIGALPLFKNYPHPTPGKPPFPAATCMSVNEQVVHGLPNDRPLQSGDIVSMDTGCSIDGWCGDAALTHPIGHVDPDVQRLLDVTRNTLELAIDLMGKKRIWSEVAAEMARYVASNGFSTVECFVGHGIGRQMHQDPQVPNFVSKQLRGSGDFRLEVGLVIAIEPMVNMGTKRVKSLADHWTQSTLDGKPSAHFEHTVAVTEEGPVALTGPPSSAEQQQFADLVPQDDLLSQWARDFVR